eukprot:3264567-Ditylum_brightwellii.AAC.1
MNVKGGKRCISCAASTGASKNYKSAVILSCLQHGMRRRSLLWYCYAKGMAIEGRGHYVPTVWRVMRGG